MAELLINYAPYETRVALLEDGTLAEFYLERPRERGCVGNIYKGRVVRVLPGMKAAFVDIGLNRTAFLYGGDLCPSLFEAEELFGEYFAQEKFKIPPIEDVLKPGQEILVQVVKEPIGNKGARLTTNVTLAGRYLVFLPTMGHIGISRKIIDEKERKRLKELIEGLRPSNTGWIIRTVAQEATEEEIKTEISFLVSLWEDIKKRAQKVIAPALLYEELDISLRAVRDLLVKEVSSLVIDNRQVYEKILSYVEELAPHLKGCIKLHEPPPGIFEAYGVEIDYHRFLARKVWLKSGGFIVIEPCEAFTAIDVNTGRFVGKDDLEETVLRTNLEAAKEIAYQLRLRNIGGLIIIDFIDMHRQESREKLYQALKQFLSRDRAKTNVRPMSEFGIIEMTRERRRESLYNLLMETCPLCHGDGVIKSKRTVCYELFRRLERMGPHIKGKNVTIKVHPDVAQVLTGEEIEFLEEIEKKFEFEALVNEDPELYPWEFKFILNSS
ncbi:ribonuclease, Rne/Rng family [Thermodesulfatator indicus DSM 15286]|uniref:Ribonuclease G n=1 Tax=Thermodesulfatator indicus (strain DSM 15286 / JCM 11887 / CIR29812) TaxID=667014 RepID=F8A7Y8_THEID|nr:Rne/Rng family ribonuclease [Thermodesulfatator indicus]AEH43904.1 ribonuclease, Rne/Rng family [Thermodesulfatator indicus DSM 15286]